MTFNLTSECLFCGTKRIQMIRDPSGEWQDNFTKRTMWHTLLRVYYAKDKHEWEDKKASVFESGWSVTVCRACRKTRTVEDLIKAAKEVF